MLEIFGWRVSFQESDLIWEINFRRYSNLERTFAERPGKPAKISHSGENYSLIIGICFSLIF